MRKPRVVIFNDNGETHHELATVFHDRSYETIIVSKTAICPIYDIIESPLCAGPVLCCDIMVAVQEGENGENADLFGSQFQIGCKLTPRNKSIVAHSLLRDNRHDNSLARGIAIFREPLDFSLFETWITDCESRMDLKQRIAVMRRAARHASGKHVQFRLSGEYIDIDAQAVNVSMYGICLKIPHPIKRGQVLHFRHQIRADAEEGIVQWAKKLEDGRYLAGVTTCA